MVWVSRRRVVDETVIYLLRTIVFKTGSSTKEDEVTKLFNAKSTLNQITIEHLSSLARAAKRKKETFAVRR